MSSARVSEIFRLSSEGRKVHWNSFNAWFEFSAAQPEKGSFSFIAAKEWAGSHLALNHNVLCVALTSDVALYTITVVCNP